MEQPSNKTHEQIVAEAEALMAKRIEDYVSAFSEILEGELSPDAIREYLTTIDEHLYEYPQVIDVFGIEQGSERTEAREIFDTEVDDPDTHARLSKQLFGTPEEIAQEFKASLYLEKDDPLLTKRRIVEIRATALLGRAYLMGSRTPEILQEQFKTILATLMEHYGVALPENVALFFSSDPDSPTAEGVRQLENKSEGFKEVLEMLLEAEGVHPELARRRAAVRQQQKKPEDIHRPDYIASQQELENILKNFPHPRDFMNLLYGLDQNSQFPE